MRILHSTTVLVALFFASQLSAADKRPMTTDDFFAVKRVAAPQISPDGRSATIQHDAIAGYMGAMTMDFTVRDTNELSHFSPGDEINFQLLVRTNDDWIQNLQLVAHHIASVTNNVFVYHPVQELGVGDLMPDGDLTSESGETIRFSDFHGRAVAFTFFFTTCPLPDFCPRMNRNFAEARQLPAAGDDFLRTICSLTRCPHCFIVAGQSQA